MTRHRCPHRSPLLVLALGAVVGLAAGGGDPATAASGPDRPTLLDVAPISRTVAALPVAPLVVAEPLAVRAPAPTTMSPGVPVASWQLADPSAGPVAGDVEGDPEAVAEPPSLETVEALQRLRGEAAGGSESGRRPGRAALVALDAALDQVGDPYVWGSSGPDAFDCSGLTSWSYARAGVIIPRVSRDQYAAGGSPVGVDELLPGDLVFFATAVWDPGVVHHVGMYVGDGLMVAAPRTGLTVRVEPVPAAGYVGAVRPVPDRAPAGTADERTTRPGRPSTAPPSTDPSSSPSAPATPTSSSSSSSSSTPATPGTEPSTPAGTGTGVPEGQPSPTPTPTATATPAPTATAAPTVTATLSPTTTATVSPVVTATLVATPLVATPQLVAPVVVRP